MDFFALLTDVANNLAIPAGAYPQFGRTLFKKYKDPIEALQFDAFISDSARARPKDIAAAAANEG